MEGAEDIMYLEEEMEQLYKIINKRLYNNDLPVPYFRMHNARYRKKGWNIQYKQNKVCQIDINQKSLDNDKNIVLEMLHQMVHIYCWKQNKKDTSRGGQYHNKIFRDIANEKGLVVDYNKNSGYQVIDISKSLLFYPVQKPRAKYQNRTGHSSVAGKRYSYEKCVRLSCQHQSYISRSRSGFRESENALSRYSEKLCLCIL